jgi:hypothetical protein
LVGISNVRLANETQIDRAETWNNSREEAKQSKLDI